MWGCRNPSLWNWVRPPGDDHSLCPVASRPLLRPFFPSLTTFQPTTAIRLESNFLAPRPASSPKASCPVLLICPPLPYMLLLLLLASSGLATR